MYPVYYVEEGDTLPHLFASFDGGTGASITMSGLAVTDIEVYKDGGTTQRASDAGYTLLDTDGIDFDGLTGIHGFSINLNDNTDAGFYSVGPWYHVVVSAITIDAQTVSFVACAFRIVSATRGMAGTALPAVAAGGAGGLPTDSTGKTAFNDLSQANVRTAVGLASANLDTQLTAIDDFLDTEIAAIKAVTDNLPNGGTLSSITSALTTIDDFLDTEIAAILADTNELQTDWANGGRLDLLIDAILDDTGTSGVVVASGSKTGYSLTPTTGLGNQTADITGTITTATNVTTVNGLAAGAITAAAIATGAIDADSLAADAATEIADAVLSRNVSNVEGTAPEHSLCTIVLASLEYAVSGTTWTIKRTDGSTTHATKTLTLNAAADPITEVT